MSDEITTEAPAVSPEPVKPVVTRPEVPEAVKPEPVKPVVTRPEVPEAVKPQESPNGLAAHEAARGAGLPGVDISGSYPHRPRV